MVGSRLVEVTLELLSAIISAAWTPANIWSFFAFENSTVCRSGEIPLTSPMAPNTGVADMWVYLPL